MNYNARHYGRDYYTLHFTECTIQPEMVTKSKNISLASHAIYNNKGVVLACLSCSPLMIG